MSKSLPNWPSAPKVLCSDEAVNVANNVASSSKRVVDIVRMHVTASGKVSPGLDSTSQFDNLLAINLTLLQAAVRNHAMHHRVAHYVRRALHSGIWCRIALLYAWNYWSLQGQLYLQVTTRTCPSTAMQSSNCLIKRVF